MIRALATAWLMLAGAALFAQPATKLEMYHLNGADPEFVLEAVRFLVGPDGNAIVDSTGQRLLVVTTPDRHAQISDLLKKFAPPTRNVLVEVRMNPVGRASETEASAEASGAFTIERDGIGGTVRLRPRVQHQSGAIESSVVQTLLVGSGREASLRIGEQVPYLEQILEYGARFGVVHSRIEWRDVGAFLNVQPTILGDGPQIRIRITPELRRLDRGGERIRFTQLATEIIARDGETISLGGFGQHAQFYNYFLIGGRRGGAAESLQILLTPRIQPAPLPRSP